MGAGRSEEGEMERRDKLGRGDGAEGESPHLRAEVPGVEHNLVLEGDVIEHGGVGLKDWSSP